MDPIAHLDLDRSGIHHRQLDWAPRAADMLSMTILRSDICAFDV